MKKILKKLGNSLVISFDAEDKKLFDLEEGGHIDIIKFEVYGLRAKIKKSKWRKKK